MSVRFLKVAGPLVTVLLFAPLVTHASLPFWGPIIPPSANDPLCAAGWGFAVEVINRIIQFSVTVAIAIVAPIMITWAGALLVTSGGNPGARTKAKSMLLSTVVGIVVALSAWLIVNALMAVLYNPDPEQGFPANWYNLITMTGAHDCIPLKASLDQADLNIGTTGVRPGPDIDYPPPSGTGACDPNVLKGIVSGLTDAEANVFACLAQPESTCGSRLQNYCWNKDCGKGKASSAYGAFQVLLSTNSSHYENQKCYDAAGVSGPLRCHKGFGPNGFLEGGDAAILQACVTAASNLECNFTAAYSLYQQSGGGVRGFNNWTADPKSNVQETCISNYYTD